MRKQIFFLLILVAGLISCGNKPTQTVERPAFMVDSAYRFVAEQVHLGARVPGTKAHQICAAYLVQYLRRFGAEVTIQTGEKTNYAGQTQAIYNIIGHFGGNPKAATVLLCAHYDTRPFSDEEDVYDRRFMPVPGANDGASGVGILLEVARQIGLQRQNDSLVGVPVDIVFFDCEDMGTPDFYTGPQRDDTWCLGAQLWAEEYAYGSSTPISEKYEYGILLDMVGAPSATFPKEYNSVACASDYVEKVWRNAAKLGYQQYFVSENCYPLIDDHYYVNKIAGIPCLDIIHYDAKANSFPYWWHTQQDNMRNIDKNTLRAVGETVLLCLNY